MEQRHEGHHSLKRESHVALSGYCEALTYIVSLEDTIFKQIDFKRYLLDAKYVKGTFLGRGGNSKAYAVKGHSDLVILSSTYNIDFFRHMIQKAEFCAKVPTSVQLARIIKVGVMDETVSWLMTRAPGKPVNINRYKKYAIWLSHIHILADAPLEHYAKLVSDVAILAQHSVAVDPSKSDNIFYHPHYGFTIIDPVVDSNAKYHSLVGPLCCYQRFMSDLDTVGAGYVLQVCEKLKAAGDSKPEIEFIESLVRRNL